MCMCVHARTRVCVCVCVCMHVCGCVHVCACTRVWMCSCVCLYTCTYVRMRTFVLACTYLVGSKYNPGMVLTGPGQSRGQHNSSGLSEESTVKKGIPSTGEPHYKICVYIYVHVKQLRNFSSVERLSTLHSSYYLCTFVYT